MSKKTIVIAWRFSQPNGHNHYSTVSITPLFDIIKFYTPANRNTQISPAGFDELKKIISEIRSDLLVFIHLPNFKNCKDELFALSKPTQNIHIIPFEGGTDFVYENFIDQESYKLKVIDADSITRVFKEMEKIYGQKAKLNSALMFLHNCLGDNTTISPLPCEFKNCQSEYNTFRKDRNNQNLRILRDAMLKEAGVL